eukprot:1454116-Amphidinium_carterae.2
MMSKGPLLVTVSFIWQDDFWLRPARNSDRVEAQVAWLWVSVGIERLASERPMEVIRTSPVSAALGTSQHVHSSEAPTKCSRHWEMTELLADLKRTVVDG